MIPYQDPQPMRLRGRGQFTIPKNIRKSLQWDESSVLNVFTVGNCLVATPKHLQRAALSKEMKKLAKKEGKNQVRLNM